jgi:hypothetical protein
LAKAWKAAKRIQKRDTLIYTDGGAFDGVLRWAFIVVEQLGDESVLTWKENGTLNPGGQHNADVETAETEAIRNAVEYIYKNPSNYEIRSDSKAVIDKLKGNVPNHSANKNIQGIRHRIFDINADPGPWSCNLRWIPRRSDAWSKYVDDLCEKDCDVLDELGEEDD